MPANSLQTNDSPAKDTFDITPTWEQLLPGLLTLYKQTIKRLTNARSHNQHIINTATEVERNFNLIAQAADKWNERQQAERNEQQPAPKTINIGTLANIVQALNHPGLSDECKDKHEIVIEEMCKLLPHGSGINRKCEIVLKDCKPDRLVFFVEFQHMNENGYYTGWTYHNVIITPSLIYGYDMKITGQNKNDIKEYLSQTFSEVFSVNI